MTPVDALDTMVLMGLKDEAEKDRELIDSKLSFDKDIYVKNFEITIRLLGGLLSSYQLTGDKRLLELADDLGTRSAACVQLAHRHALCLREPEDRRDEGRGKQSGGDWLAADRVRNPQQADE